MFVLAGMWVLNRAGSGKERPPNRSCRAGRKRTDGLASRPGSGYDGGRERPVCPTSITCELLLEQVEQRMKNQRDEWDGLDRKATTILATTGVLLGLVAANAKAFGATPSPGPAAFVLAAAALALRSLPALWPSSRDASPMCPTLSRSSICTRPRRPTRP